MRELRNRADVAFLIDTFYKKVLTDKTIGYFFTEVVKLDWGKHIPLMVDFWETVLFGGNKYKGNPMLIHMQLHKKEALHPKHFERWIQIWQTTVKTNFSGEFAIKAIERAKTVGEVIMMRIKQNEDESGFNINLKINQTN